MAGAKNLHRQGCLVTVHHLLSAKQAGVRFGHLAAGPLPAPAEISLVAVLPSRQ